VNQRADATYFQGSGHGGAAAIVFHCPLQGGESRNRTLVEAVPLHYQETVTAVDLHHGPHAF
jgi:hypothetical protein